MRVLFIGTDRGVCDESSRVSARLDQYAHVFGSIDVIVYSLVRHACVSSSRGGRVYVHPTQSSSRMWYIWHAVRIGMRLPKPDVISVQDPFESGITGIILSLVRRVPLHVQVHTDPHRHLRAYGSLSWVMGVASWIVLRHATRVRVVSESVQDAVASRVRHTTSVAVLPIYIDTQKFSSIVRVKHPRWKISLVSIGRLEPEKQFIQSIQSLALLRAHGHDAGLTIVGDGRLHDELLSYSRENGLERFVDFVGAQQDVTPYLGHADVVLVPSAYEGYGLAIVEALAARVPVIAYDVGVAREAGALIAPHGRFSDTVLEWAAAGPRAAELRGYPYRSERDFTEKITKDISACVNGV